MRLTICVTHAAFSEERRTTFQRLMEQLYQEARPEDLLVAAADHDRKGSLWCWREAMRLGLATEATHIVWLPDDAILPVGFRDALERAITARPTEVFDCAVNHIEFTRPEFRVDANWYTTHDGYCGVGGVMPRALLEEHLVWRDDNLGWAWADDPHYVANDLGVNFWAMATGRLIWKPTVSLVGHDASIPSLDGNPSNNIRQPQRLVEDASGVSFDGAPVHLGRTYNGNHWEMLHHVERPSAEVIERAYEAHRQGAKVSEKPHVFIAMPAYVQPEAAVRVSVERIVADLHQHGIASTVFENGGDSLVTRGRHGLVHEMLCTPATHLLQWDADIECLDHTAVRKMVETGYDVVGGAYPWRDGSGRVVANPLAETVRDKEIDVDTGAKCLRVAEVGTGFLLTSRKILVDLAQRHPELMYMADIEPYVGAPMWALFDAYLEMRDSGRRRYASEDWRFCQLARQAGYGVHVYYPPVFRHWGKTAHQGHIVKAWGLQGPSAPP